MGESGTPRKVHFEDSFELEEFSMAPERIADTLNGRSLWDRIRFGPDSPSDPKPRYANFLHSLEVFPKWIRKRFPPYTRYFGLFIYCLLWISMVYLILRPSFQFDEKVISLTCVGDNYFWKGKNAACGLDARKCHYKDDVVIRCPAMCDRSWTYTSRVVGDKDVKYTGYFIGGGSSSSSETISLPYRADSFPCGSAVHAGAVSKWFGGAVTMSFTGQQSQFPSRDGSIGFDSVFPESFVFKKSQYKYIDPMFFLLFVNVLLGLPVFYLFEQVGYWIINIAGFWMLVLSFDSPQLIYDQESLADLIQLGFERLLPLSFVLYFVWNVCIGYTMKESSPVSKILLWYPTFWIGVCNNVTFDRLPVDRLTVDMLSSVAVLSLIGLIVLCAAIQARAVWRAGKFWHYARVYMCVIGILTVLALVPGLHLRIHHYILGILLLPGCRTRGKSAYLFQGVLVGLIISGIARWGFASIIETTKSLRRDDAGGRMEPPSMVYSSASNALNFKSTGNVSLLINDVERYRGDNTTIDLSQLISSLNLEEDKQVSLYLRAAHVVDKKVGDYTRPGTLVWPERLWTGPLPGIT